MKNEAKSPSSSDRQEEEMTEALLAFAKYAIQNARAHLSTVELFDAVEILQKVERLIEDKLIELAPPADPGSSQPAVEEMDLRDL